MMPRFASLLCASLCAAPLVSLAQDPAAADPPPRPVLSPSDSAAVERAGRLVADGQGLAGRALIDTLLSLAAPGSGRYAEFLFWRAAYAATAAEAERDYRRLAVEFPLSPRSEDALVALAQLEMARGDRELALRHIERLTLEHPSSRARAKAGYWAARIYFEMNDPQRACVVLQAARNAAATAPAELASRIESEMQRCRGMQVGEEAGSGAGTRADSVVATRPTAAPPASASAATPPPAVVRPQPATPPPTPARDTAPPVRAPTPSVAAAGTVVVRPDSSPPPRPPAPAPSGTSSSGTSSSGGRASFYSIQIAAYDTPADAEASARRVRGRGLEARVDAEGGMYKVRVGRYRTRAEAAAALRDVKGKGMRDAWVVTATGQP